MAKSKRKDPQERQMLWKIVEGVGFLDSDALNGNLTDIVAKLVDWKAKSVEQGFEEVQLEVEHDRDYYGCEGISVRLGGNRLENDKEYEDRMRLIEWKKGEANRLRKARTAAEKREFARLKKKFEG